MSNKTILESIALTNLKGGTSYGFTLTDGHGRATHIGFSCLVTNNLALLRQVYTLRNSMPELKDILTSVIENHKGMDINGEWFDWDALAPFLLPPAKQALFSEVDRMKFAAFVGTILTEEDQTKIKADSMGCIELASEVANASNIVLNQVLDRSDEEMCLDWYETVSNVAQDLREDGIRIRTNPAELIVYRPE